MLEQNEMVLKFGQVRIQDRGEGTVRRTFDRYGNLTHDFLTSPEHAGPDSTQMEERGYRRSLFMPEFDTLLTGEEVARNLKVSKDLGPGSLVAGTEWSEKAARSSADAVLRERQRGYMASVRETSS
jgi:hypothetical protein